MFAVKTKIYGVIYKQSSSIAFDETSMYWSAPKNSGSLVSIDQHFVATRVVHLPKSTETSLITESDQSGPNNQLLQLCTASTAWSDSDQAVLAVHNCNSWFALSFTHSHYGNYMHFCIKVAIEVSSVLLYPFTLLHSLLCQSVAQSVAPLTHSPEVPGSRPGPVTYFRFSVR